MSFMASNIQIWFAIAAAARRRAILLFIFVHAQSRLCVIGFTEMDMSSIHITLLTLVYEIRVELSNHRAILCVS